jgi:hypothetical protein
MLVSEVLASHKGQWYCSLDHSQLGPFCIAILAVSHRKGRAIPIWCQVNVSEAGLVAPLLAALEELFQFLQSNAPDLQLVLVMDRWFASDKLFTLFEQYGIYFIARTKGDKLVQLPWDPSWWREPIHDISHLELPTTYRKHKLRLIRSDYNETMKDPEPWFLLTNLPDSGNQRSSEVCCCLCSSVGGSCGAIQQKNYQNKEPTPRNSSVGSDSLGSICSGYFVRHCCHRFRWLSYRVKGKSEGGSATRQ